MSRYLLILVEIVCTFVKNGRKKRGQWSSGGKGRPREETERRAEFNPLGSSPAGVRRSPIWADSDAGTPAEMVPPLSSFATTIEAHKG